MTLYVFPDPTDATEDILDAGKDDHYPTATIGMSYPTTAISVPHIQHAWDGTPSEQVNRERCTIRVTVWTPKGKVSDGINLAALVRAYLLSAGSDTVWQYRPGAGRVAGIDPSNKLPFCTFTLTAETRPYAVA